MKILLLVAFCILVCTQCMVSSSSGGVVNNGDPANPGNVFFCQFFTIINTLIASIVANVLNLLATIFDLLIKLSISIENLLTSVVGNLTAIIDSVGTLFNSLGEAVKLLLAPQLNHYKSTTTTAINDLRNTTETLTAAAQHELIDTSTLSFEYVNQQAVQINKTIQEAIAQNNDFAHYTYQKVGPGLAEFPSFYYQLVHSCCDIYGNAIKDALHKVDKVSLGILSDIKNLLASILNLVGNIVKFLEDIIHALLLGGNSNVTKASAATETVKQDFSAASSAFKQCIANVESLAKQQGDGIANEVNGYLLGQF